MVNVGVVNRLMKRLMSMIISKPFWLNIHLKPSFISVRTLLVGPPLCSGWGMVIKRSGPTARIAVATSMAITY